MTDQQSNWLDMYSAAYDYYKSKQAIIDTTPVLATVFASLNAKKSAIKLSAQGQTITTTGSAVNKQAFRDTLDTLSYGIMAPVSGWAFDQKKMELHANTKDAFSFIQRITDETYPNYLRLRHQMISAIIADLGPLNITAVMLDAWNTAIDDYEGLITAPRLAITNKKVFTDNLPTLFSETNKFLKNVLDKLMIGIKATQPDIYAGYVLSREVIDRGHGPKTDPVPVTPPVNPPANPPITGSINSGKVITIMDTTNPLWVPGVKLSIKNTSAPGAGNLYFYLADNSMDGYNGHGSLLNPGQAETHEIIPAEFKPFFNIQNQSPENQNYEVTIL